MPGHLIGGAVNFSTSPTAAGPHPFQVEKFKPKFIQEVEQSRCLQGWVTHVDNPLCFYIQFSDSQTTEYLEMLRKLNLQAACLLVSVAENPQTGKLFIKFYFFE
jgi:hypothetical protein